MNPPRTQPEGIITIRYGQFRQAARSNLSEAALRFSHPAPFALRGFLIVTVAFYIAIETFFLTHFLETAKHLLDTLVAPGFDSYHKIIVPLRLQFIRPTIQPFNISYQIGTVNRILF